MGAPDPRHWGIQPGYRDHRGRWVEPPPETVAAALEALGADAGAPPEPGALVVQRGDRLPAPEGTEVVLEEGATRPCPPELPGDLPDGYHMLSGRNGERRLVVSPGRCHLPPDLRTWGWAVQLYSVRSGSSWGIGDLGDLARLGSWARSEGAGLLLLNPLFAARPGGGQQPSPYFPSSRLWMNPLYADLGELAGHCDLADLRREAAALNRKPIVDRDAVWALKLQALERAFIAEPTPEPPIEQALLDFATYQTLSEHLGGVPSGWPTELAHARAPGVGAFRAAHARRVAFHAWVQQLLHSQLQSARRHIDLVCDLPVGVDPEGADVWTWPEAFCREVEVGAPPDEFNTRGQTWGLPPFNPVALAQADYEPFIQTVRAALRLGGGLRVDHVMGLWRLFWVPRGAEPSQGVYVRYPARDLLNILALESSRARALVIGEDLGTVEPQVREEMARRSMLGYRVLWFEPEPPERWPEGAMATVTNHDLPTIAGLWTGTDLERQRALGLEPNVEGTRALRARVAAAAGLGDDSPVPEVVARVYELLARAPSRVLLATLEDACASPERPNFPGSTDARNWSVPLPLQLEELERSPLPARIARALGSR